jgi:hypothetical protein
MKERKKERKKERNITVRGIVDKGWHRIFDTANKFKNFIIASFGLMTQPIIIYRYSLQARVK